MYPLRRQAVHLRRWSRTSDTALALKNLWWRIRCPVASYRFYKGLSDYKKGRFSA